MELKNVMEEIVIQKVDEIITTMDCCRCEQCRLDVVSYVLNQFPSKYVATSEGQLISKVDSLDKEFEIHIVMETVKAIQMVKENPHHKT